MNEILRKSTENERKRLFRKEKSTTWKIARSWTFLVSTMLLAQLLCAKFSLKKSVHSQSARLLRILFYSLRAVGKFIVSLKTIREKKLFRLMGGIVKAKVGLWKTRRNYRAKKHVVEFVHDFEETKAAMFLIKGVAESVQKVRKWTCRVIARKRFLLAAANYQWGLLESVVVKNRRRKIAAKEMDEAIKAGKGTEMVPLDVRLVYMKSFLSALNKTNYERQRIYWKSIRALRAKALQEWELKNVERLLRGIPKEPFVFVPPPPPVFRVFISCGFFWCEEIPGHFFPLQ